MVRLEMLNKIIAATLVEKNISQCDVTLSLHILTAKKELIWGEAIHMFFFLLKYLVVHNTNKRQEENKTRESK